MTSEFGYQVDEDPCEICVGPVLIEHTFRALLEDG
jgi:hypothetical protein